MSVEEMCRSLRARVAAANRDFQLALTLHEAWKPTVFDDELKVRLGASHATSTFMVIRNALRRDMLMSLMRVWDTHKDAPKLSSIKEHLQNHRVVSMLIEDAVAPWKNVEPASPQAQSVEAFRTIKNAMDKWMEPMIEAEAQRIRNEAGEIILMLRSYERGNSKGEHLALLARIRDQFLAHRQLNRQPLPPELEDQFDGIVEEVYSDTSRIIRLARRVAESVNADHDEYERLNARNAGLFWASVKGERTPGHPAYIASNEEGRSD